ncbi:alpha-L-fucosidase [Bifidobacterium asteroides]|uniref:alpha-L-fucosidase n=1 Tax=Bifidobacterium asteroides TaxID=1684 RepID=A0A6N7TTD2_9BIFI|nr:alpha-L-fucosidase [Bifidobacterium asteroides]MSD90721.1 alpha-L-fucosidase [Bifidobacterium asteroides]
MNLDYLANIKPSRRQLDWQRMEMYAFMHFGMNTMTDREWGLGHEDPALFNPADLDCDQWMETFKAAGMTGVILTCKHHDGFCLWPSAYTDHSVASSPWKGGKGDVVREVSQAAHRHGLKFGVYLSPWDRTEATYGQGKAYDDYYVNQLIELLTHYGPVFSVWMDGANGEGPNGKIQAYDWQRYFNVIRALQPEAVISICGPDVRWCGNEAGKARENEWSVVPATLSHAEWKMGKGELDHPANPDWVVRSEDEDLGSRKILEQYGGPLVWYPAEVDTSIRPGWFHHASEDDKVRTADELFDIWSTTVGGNANLVLNVPSNAQGKISQPDVDSLTGLGRRIREFWQGAVTEGAKVSVSSNACGSDPQALLSTGVDSGWWLAAADDEHPTVTIDFDRPRQVDGLILREHIEVGQRVEQVVISAELDGELRQVAEVGAVGYQHFAQVGPLTTSHLEVSVTRLRGPVALDTCLVREGGARTE